MTDNFVPALTSTLMSRAIYIDFETLKTRPPHPALLGILLGSEGEALEQLILDPALAPARKAKPTRTRDLAAGDAVDTILNLARSDDSPIVGWSLFDRDRLIDARPDLGSEIRDRYVNALAIARRWRHTVHPHHAVVRTGPFAARHTLDQYAALAGYRHVRILARGRPAHWIRQTRQQLIANGGRYRRMTFQARRDWHRVLEYNRHDLLALRHIAVRAARELELWRSYERTRFCVNDGKQRICFMAGSKSRRLNALLERTGARTWAFISAWNPHSQPLAAAQNARRHAELVTTVAQRGLDTLPGEGIGEDPAWPPEESLLVLNISRGEAVRLGRRFGQLAIVAGRRGGPPALVPVS
jgi:hypothetical protein